MCIIANSGWTFCVQSLILDQGTQLGDAIDKLYTTVLSIEESSNCTTALCTYLSDVYAFWKSWLYRSDADRVKQAAEDRLQKDAVLKQAYETSQRVGDLLLKSEAEELEQVSKYADELLQKEYRWGWAQSIRCVHHLLSLCFGYAWHFQSLCRLC